MRNLTSYSILYDEFLSEFGDVDRSKLPGVAYRIDRIRVLPLIAAVVLFIIGLIGNIWVTCVIGCIISRSSTKAHKSVQIYILALCCCDLIVVLFSLALILDLFYGEWLVESKFLCLLYLSSESLQKFCSPFLLVALSYFCYMKIYKPRPAIGSVMTGGQFFNGDVLRSTLIALVCVVLSFVALIPVYMYGDLHYIIYESNSTLIAIVPKCAFEADESVLWAFTVYGFTLGYATPTLMFTCFHAAIILKVGRLRNARTIGISARRANAKFIRVTRTILGLVVFYVACWTPYWSMMLYRALLSADEQGELSDTGVILNYFVHMLPYVNCTGYPIVYTLMNRDIRDAYSRVKAKQASRSRIMSTCQSLFSRKSVNTIGFSKDVTKTETSL